MGRGRACLSTFNSFEGMLPKRSGRMVNHVHSFSWTVGRTAALNSYWSWGRRRRFYPAAAHAPECSIAFGDVKKASESQMRRKYDCEGGGLLVRGGITFLSHFPFTQYPLMNLICHFSHRREDCHEGESFPTRITANLKRLRILTFFLLSFFF